MKGKPIDAAPPPVPARRPSTVPPVPLSPVSQRTRQLSSLPEAQSEPAQAFYKGQTIDVATEDGLEKGAVILGPSTTGDPEFMSVKVRFGHLSHHCCSLISHCSHLFDIKFADGVVDDWEIVEFVAVAHPTVAAAQARMDQARAAREQAEHDAELALLEEQAASERAERIRLIEAAAAEAEEEEHRAMAEAQLHAKRAKEAAEITALETRRSVESAERAKRIKQLEDETAAVEEEERIAAERTKVRSIQEQAEPGGGEPKSEAHEETAEEKKAKKAQQKADWAVTKSAIKKRMAAEREAEEAPITAADEAEEAAILEASIAAAVETQAARESEAQQRTGALQVLSDAEAAAAGVAEDKAAIASDKLRAHGGVMERLRRKCNAIRQLLVVSRHLV